MSEIIITEQYLKNNPDHIFVFGDNLLRYGTGGAAKLRYMPNTYGFITKKAPTYKDEDFYSPHDYASVFNDEMIKLWAEITSNRDKVYLISKIGAGIANKHNIWKYVIEPRLEKLRQINEPNVKFLYERRQ